MPLGTSKTPFDFASHHLPEHPPCPRALRPSRRHAEPHILRLCACCPLCLRRRGQPTLVLFPHQLAILVCPALHPEADRCRPTGLPCLLVSGAFSPQEATQETWRPEERVSWVCSPCSHALTAWVQFAGDPLTVATAAGGISSPPAIPGSHHAIPCPCPSRPGGGNLAQEPRVPSLAPITLPPHLCKRSFR